MHVVFGLGVSAPELNDADLHACNVSRFLPHLKAQKPQNCQFLSQRHDFWHAGTF
jgi:hypothetical protein